MSDKETDASPILSLPHTFSYMSATSSFTCSDTTSISATRSTFEYSTSSTGRSIDDETLILTSETRLMPNRVHRIVIALPLPIDLVVRQLKGQFQTAPL